MIHMLEAIEHPIDDPRNPYIASPTPERSLFERLPETIAIGKAN